VANQIIYPPSRLPETTLIEVVSESDERKDTASIPARSRWQLTELGIYNVQTPKEVTSTTLPELSSPERLVGIKSHPDLVETIDRVMYEGCGDYDIISKHPDAGPYLSGRQIKAR